MIVKLKVWKTVSSMKIRFWFWKIITFLVLFLWKFITIPLSLLSDKMIQYLVQHDHATYEQFIVRDEMWVDSDERYEEHGWHLR